MFFWLLFFGEGGGLKLLVILGQINTPFIYFNKKLPGMMAYRSSQLCVGEGHLLLCPQLFHMQTGCI